MAAVEADDGQTPSVIDSHKFSPCSGRQEDLCVCGISRAAHSDEIDPYDTSGLAYRCPYCVDRGIASCLHGRRDGLDMKGQPLDPPTPIVEDGVM